MTAALLNKSGEAIGEVLDAPPSVRTIPVAERFTSCDLPINVEHYRVSRSIVNLRRAKKCPIVGKHGMYWVIDNAPENEL